MTQMLRLMLVDDHEVVRLGMRALLERHPSFTVVGEAATEDEAVALALESVSYTHLDVYKRQDHDLPSVIDHAVEQLRLYSGGLSCTTARQQNRWS